MRVENVGYGGNVPQQDVQKDLEKPVKEKVEQETVIAKNSSGEPADREATQAEAESDLSPVESSLGKDFDVRVDEEVDRIVVSVIDKKSGEVVRQIPPEETINYLKSFNKNVESIIDLTG